MNAKSVYLNDDARGSDVSKSCHGYSFLLRSWKSQRFLAGLVSQTRCAFDYRICAIPRPKIAVWNREKSAGSVAKMLREGCNTNRGQCLKATQVTAKRLLIFIVKRCVRTTYFLFHEICNYELEIICNRRCSTHRVRYTVQRKFANIAQKYLKNWDLHLSIFQK